MESSISCVIKSLEAGVSMDIMLSISLTFCCTTTVMLLTPSEDMESVTEPLTASPTQRMPMTDAMPHGQRGAHLVGLQAV